MFATVGEEADSQTGKEAPQIRVDMCRQRWVCVWRYLLDTLDQPRVVVEKRAAPLGWKLNEQVFYTVSFSIGYA